MTTPTPRTGELVRVLAEWEDKNGTMAAIMPHEWAELMRPVMNACMSQSPRQIRAELAQAREELAEERSRLDYPAKEIAELRERATKAEAERDAARTERNVAVSRAFRLGETYWQQADSESYSQNRKSIETMRKFRQLLSGENDAAGEGT